jgi:hypothetical protein
VLLHVPASLDGLLSLFSSCFTQPTFQTFRALVVGQISQTGLRTVTGMLVGARLSGIWHHARAHRFFSCARWSADRVGLLLAAWVCERLLAPGETVVVAVDDSLCRRAGTKVHACFWHRDVTARSEGMVAAWGNSWVVAGIIVRLPFLDRRVCLPVLFRLWQPKRKQFGKKQSDPERPGKTELARELVDLLADRLPDRELRVLGDSAYASKAWRGLPDRVSATFRLPRHAILYAPPPPASGTRGRPRTWGPRLGSVEQLANDPTIERRNTTVRCYEKTWNVTLATIDGRWQPLGPDTPVRLIIARNHTRDPEQPIAVLTTELDTTAAQTIERYAERWSIEVSFEQGKQLFGVGHARNRTPKAVERTVPFQYLAMSLTIGWYTLHGHDPNVVSEHRQRAPWYQTKTTPSFADMLAKLRRVILAAQFHPGRDSTPTTQQISQVHQAWAAAGL